MGQLIAILAAITIVAGVGAFIVGRRQWRWSASALLAANLLSLIPIGLLEAMLRSQSIPPPSYDPTSGPAAEWYRIWGWVWLPSIILAGLCVAVALKLFAASFVWIGDDRAKRSSSPVEESRTIRMSLQAPLLVVHAVLTILIAMAVAVRVASHYPTV